MKFVFFFFRYYNLFSTFLSVLAGVSPSSVYSYRGITVGIFKEISDKGFTIGSLVVISALAITVEIAVVRKEFIIFEFISN